eukprot:Em0336g1a
MMLKGNTTLKGLDLHECGLEPEGLEEVMKGVGVNTKRTGDHGNADVLSRLPVGPDISFDEDEDVADVDTVCTIKTVSLQLDPTDPGTMAKEWAKDPVIANNKPPKLATNPPEKPWSGVHVNHAIIFLGCNWLVLIDAYSKYPSIHPTTSTSTKSTTELLEQDLLIWLSTHYSERLVQTFKQALLKSSPPPRAALQEFLMQYRRTPLVGRSGPRLMLYSLPQCSARGQAATKSQECELPNKVVVTYNVGSPCYALYYGPRREKDPRWVLAVVTKRFGTCSVNVRVVPRGGTWRRHVEQLCPRYVDQEDTDPGPVQIQTMEPVVSLQEATLLADGAPTPAVAQMPVPVPPPVKKAQNPRLPTQSSEVIQATHF